MTVKQTSLQELVGNLLEGATSTLSDNLPQQKDVEETWKLISVEDLAEERNVPNAGSAGWRIVDGDGDTSNS